MTRAIGFNVDGAPDEPVEWEDRGQIPRHPRRHLRHPLCQGPIFKLPAFLKLSNTDPFAAWFVVTGDATPDGIRVVRSVLGAISTLPWTAGLAPPAPPLAPPPRVLGLGCGFGDWGLEC